MNEKALDSTPIVNGDTGELIGNLFSGDKLTIIRGGSLMAYAKLKTHSGRYDIHKNETYGKFYNEGFMRLLQEDLTSVDLRMILSAMVYLQKYNTGELVHGNGLHVKAQTLIETANVAKNHGYTSLKRLVDKGILAKERRGKHDVYFANPYLFVRGNEIDGELLERFKDTKWAKQEDKR